MPLPFLFTGLLVDIFHDYRYLFLMSGSVILFAGLFLLIMNIFNYYLLKKEQLVKQSEQNENNMEKQEQGELKQAAEMVKEQIEPEAIETAENQKGTSPDVAETSK